MLSNKLRQHMLIGAIVFASSISTTLLAFENTQVNEKHIIELYATKYLCWNTLTRLN